MGLDNGVRIKNFDKNYTKYFTLMWNFEEEDNEFDICYWRKCWNVREIFISTLHMTNGQYEQKLDPEDIKPLIKKLGNLLSAETWDDSIWEFEEYFGHMIDCICNLKMLQFYMQDHPGCEVYFYDSY